MKNSHRILLSALLIITASGLLGYEAAVLLNGLFHFRSPMKDNPPPPGEAFKPPLTDRVVVILLDGLRVDTAYNSNLMPELGRMRTLGASATMTSRPPSYSEPGYATILTGAWPDINDGPAFNLAYGEIPTITQETIFTVAKAAGLKTAISAYYWFEELIPQVLIDQSFYTPGEDREADRQVVAATRPWLLDESINLMLIHIDQIDYAGHYEGGGIGTGWDEAASRSDRLLEELIAQINLTTTTVLIFSDHGHIDPGGHGGHDSITLQEPFVAAGAGILPGEFEPIQMIDLAPTIAVLLGTSLPSSSEGRPLVEMLTLSSSQLRDITALHTAQQGGLINAYTETLGSDATNQVEIVSDSQTAIAAIQSGNLVGGRVVRSILAGVFLGCLGYFSYRNRKSVLPIMAGSAAFLLSFHLLFSVLPGRFYSFSIIASPEAFIIDAIGWTAASYTMAAIVSSMITGFWRESLTDLVRKSLAFTAFIMLVAGIPALWYFILYGPFIRTILPDIGLLFRAMLSLLEVIAVGVCGLLLTGVTATMTNLFARHKP
jgi:hypothetical protein